MSGPLKNSRHEKFAQNMALDMSAAEAYRKAGYSKVGAKENASRLITNDNVSARIKELKERAADKTVMTLAERRRFLADVVRTAISDIDENSILCQEFTVDTIGGGFKGKLKRGNAPEGNEVETPEITRTRFKVPDKLKAIELDSRLAGDFKEKVELTGDGLLELLNAVRGGAKE